MCIRDRNRQYDSSVIDLLTLRVTADFEPKIKEGRISVEDIQDSVETVLSQSGYADVAKAYILYRRQREKLRNTEATLLDYKQVVDNYLKAVSYTHLSLDSAFSLVYTVLSDIPRVFR